MHLQVVRLNVAKEKSRNMFSFSKSDADLRNKSDVQYKVICDWLRTTQNLVRQLDRSNKVIQLDIAKLYDLLLKDDSPPADVEYDDSSSNGSVS